MKSAANVFIVGNFDNNKEKIINLYKPKYEIKFFASQAELIANEEENPLFIVLDPFAPLYKSHNAILRIIGKKWPNIAVHIYTSDKNNYYAKKIYLQKNSQLNYYKNLQHPLIFEKRKETEKRTSFQNIKPQLNSITKKEVTPNIFNDLMKSQRTMLELYY
jgi:hypothetical protein